MANHMAEVAKMLGVELGEEFMCNNWYKYVLREDGVVAPNYDNFSGDTFSTVLNDLLTGKLVIKRKHWKPKDRELYWCVTALEGTIAANEWHNNWMDIVYYKLGNCYRSKGEAKVNRDKWLAFYASDEVLEV